MKILLTTFIKICVVAFFLTIGNSAFAAVVCQSKVTITDIRAGEYWDDHNHLSIGVKADGASQSTIIQANGGHNLNDVRGRVLYNLLTLAFSTNKKVSLMASNNNCAQGFSAVALHKD